MLAENYDINTFMKRETTIDGFEKRPAFFRKAKGFTQKESGDHICVSNSVISYYERESKYPPVHLIAALANILGVSTTDELLGLKEIARDVVRKLIEAQTELSGDLDLSAISDKFDYPLIVNT